MFLRTRTVALLFVIVALTACPKDSATKQAAKKMVEVAKALEVIQTTTIDANTNGLLPDASAVPIVEALVRMNLAGKRATAILRSVDKLDPNSETAVIQAIDLVLEELAKLNFSALPASTRQTIDASLSLARASLNSARLLIAAGGNTP